MMFSRLVVGRMKCFAEVCSLIFLLAILVNHFRAMLRHLSSGCAASDESWAVCERIGLVLNWDN
jgi:hypothetical protein